MCGIFGYVGKKNNVGDLILTGLKTLEYRGYDSWGIAYKTKDDISIYKKVGKISDVKAKDFKKIEPIVDTVFGLNNEFWVSFFIKNVMYDKKYIFLPETIKDENLILIPLLNKKGVIIK